MINRQAGRQDGATTHTGRRDKYVLFHAAPITVRRLHTCMHTSRRRPSCSAAEGRRHKIVERPDLMDLSCGFRGLRCPILQTHTHHNKQQKTNTRSIPPTQYNNSHRLPPCVASRARRGCKKGGQAGARRPAAWIEGEDPATGVLLVQRHR